MERVVARPTGPKGLDRINSLTGQPGEGEVAARELAGLILDLVAREPGFAGKRVTYRLREHLKKGRTAGKIVDFLVEKGHLVRVRGRLFLPDQPELVLLRLAQNVSSEGVAA